MFSLYFFNFPFFIVFRFYSINCVYVRILCYMNVILKRLRASLVGDVQKFTWIYWLEGAAESEVTAVLGAIYLGKTIGHTFHNYQHYVHCHSDVISTDREQEALQYKRFVPRRWLLWWCIVQSLLQSDSTVSVCTCRQLMTLSSPYHSPPTLSLHDSYIQTGMKILKEYLRRFTST